MADTVTAAPVASKAAAVDLSAAIAEALRQSQLNKFGVASVGPTERTRAAAAAIAKGTPVERAMADAGYGRKYIEGNAAGFPAFLEKCGLLTAAQARKATGAVLAGGGE